MKLNELKKMLRKYSSKEKKAILQKFFKTAPGEYGEGDIFLGVKVPDTRKVARAGRDLRLEDVKKLISSKIHEERLLGLLILIIQYEKGDDSVKEKIYKLYLNNTNNINNWDLVDLSSPNIAGDFLMDKKKDKLYSMAKSKMLWERRIAIVATHKFIRNNKLTETFKIAAMLINDKEDLIHKAAGWMLREAGKRNRDREEKFLKKHYKNMPRTMLRYAIEKFPEPLRQSYLKG